MPPDPIWSMRNEIMDKIFCSAIEEAVCKYSPMSYHHYSQSSMIVIDHEQHSVTSISECCVSNSDHWLIKIDWKIHHINVGIWGNIFVSFFQHLGNCVSGGLSPQSEWYYIYSTIEQAMLTFKVTWQNWPTFNISESICMQNLNVLCIIRYWRHP